MILKELDLDAPQLTKEARHCFRNEVRCVAAHYFSFLPSKFEVGAFWKILVECVAEEGPSKIYMDVMTVKVRFDFQQYEQQTPVNKKKMLLSVLHNAILQLAFEYNWNTSPFQHCFSSVEKDEFQYIWQLKRTKKSRDRKLSASIICHHDIDQFVATLIIQDSNAKELKREVIFTEVPNEFAFEGKLGDFKWLSNTEIEVCAKDKQVLSTIILDQTG